MLIVSEDVILLKVVHCVAHYDMFQLLTAHAGKRDWSVVDSVMSSTLFVHGGTFACLQSSGTVPSWSDVLKIRVRIGANSAA